jgi:hypothetical protein
MIEVESITIANRRSFPSVCAIAKVGELVARCNKKQKWV